MEDITVNIDCLTNQQGKNSPLHRPRLDSVAEKEM